MTVAKLLFLLLVTQLVSAQTPAPAFEVATIKPAAPNFDGHVHINYPPGDRFSATNITLRALMQWAYAMPETQILGGPSWLSSTRFDIQAKADIGEQMKSLSSEEANELKRRMVQALLRGAVPAQSPSGDSCAAGVRPCPSQRWLEATTESVQRQEYRGWPRPLQWRGAYDDHHRRGAFQDRRPRCRR